MEYLAFKEEWDDETNRSAEQKAVAFTRDFWSFSSSSTIPGIWSTSGKNTAKLF
jgi:hypothetical protein